MTLLRLAVLLSLAGTSALAATPERSERRQSRLPASWGKAGVTLDQYAVDGGVCAWQAIQLDIANTEPARRLVAASRHLEHADARAGSALPPLADPTAGAQPTPIPVDAGRDYREAIDRYRPDEQFEAIRDIQSEALARCLTERGYTRFRLTEEQARELRRLRRGSPERRAFLHRLGSDPEVIARQAAD